MDNWVFALLSAVLFIFALYIGFLCGQWACERRVTTKREYWIANALGCVAVILLTWVFSLLPLLQFAPVGWLGGFIAGLKMSFGESVGLWRKHDEVLNINKKQREVADAGTGDQMRRNRRAAREGKSEAQLISVKDNKKAGGTKSKRQAK